MAEKKKLPNLISARNSDLGFQYERLIGIYLAIKCVSRSDLDDFQLVFNAKDHGSIDDVVIRIFSQNKLTKVLLCQFKHKDNKGGISLKQEFIKYENAYKLLRQDKMYSEDEIAVVLFTNGRMIFPEGITKNPIIFNDKDILSIFYTNKDKNKSYQLTHKNNNYNNWFYFGEQINAHGANKSISNCLDNHFTEKEIQQINIYFQNVLPKRKESFCKSDIISILSDILLSPFVLTHDPGDEPIKNSNTNPLLFKTLMKFKITKISENNSKYLMSCLIYYVEKKLNVQLSNLQWDQELTEDIVAKLFSMEEMKTYATLKIQNNPLTKKDLLLLFWSKGELPLLLKTDESNYGKIKFCLNNFTSKSKLSVVLCDEHNLVTNLNDDLTVFNNLFDLKQENDELLPELLEDTKIFLYLKETSLKEIADKDEKMWKTINPDCFVELFCRSITIPSIPIKPPFYIDREIQIKLYNKDVVQSKAFISIVDADSSLPNLENYTDDAETIFYSKHTAEVTAKLVTEKITDKKFCCFQTFGDKFYCYLTNFQNLNPIERYSVNQLVCEKDLLNHSSASKIIHGPAGMGKTTFLQNLAGNSTTNQLYIYIHVNDLLKNDVYKASFKSKKSLADYLSKTINDSQENHLTSFISAFLLNCLNENRLQLLFDGFDETSASPEVFSRLLNELTVPFILCTRSEKITDLQVALRTSTVFKLMEFDGNDQKEFVQEQTENDSEVEPQEIIDKIVDEFSKTSILNFLGKPLLLKMITNIFQGIKEDLKEWNIVNILNKFIKKQMDVYQSEASKENVKKLACHVFFEDKILRKILINNKDVIALLKDFHVINKTDGIISNVNAAKEVQFTHRVYAEFLCAQYLFELFTNANQDELKEYSKIYELLFAEDIIPVRYFLDLLLSEKIPLFTAVLLNDYHKVEEILNNSETNEFKRDEFKRDKLGRSIMHLIMGYGDRYNYPYKINGLKNIKTLKTYNLYKIDKQFSINIRILIKIENSVFNYEKDSFGNFPYTYGFYSRSYKFLEETSYNLKLSFVPEINKTTFFIYFIGYHNLRYLLKACLKLQLYTVMEWKMNGKERLSIVDFYKTFKTIVEDFDIEKISQIILNENFTILHMASMKDLHFIVKVILKRNLGVEHCKDSDDYTALDYAIRNNNKYLINLLKKRNCISKIVWKELYGEESKSSSVYNAVINSNLDSLKLCIDKEDHLNSHVTYYGETILEIAAGYASSEILCFLIDKMKPSKIVMAKLLYCSMKKSNHDNINYLIKFEMDLGHEIRGGTVMHWAAFYGDSDLILSLIEKGCDINVMMNDKTPILYAIENQNIETLKCLIEQNVDLNFRYFYNWNVMHWAARYGNLEIIKILKDNEGNIDYLDHNKTPIYSSIFEKNVDSLKALIDLGANLEHKINDNNSIMHYAAEYGNAEIITYLISRGCSMEISNNGNRTPIYEALYRGNIETLNCLREHGAKLNALSDDLIKTIFNRYDYETIFEIICSYEEVQQLGGMSYIKGKIQKQIDEEYASFIERLSDEWDSDDSYEYNKYKEKWDRLLRFLQTNED